MAGKKKQASSACQVGIVNEDLCKQTHFQGPPKGTTVWEQPDVKEMLILCKKKKVSIDDVIEHLRQKHFKKVAASTVRCHLSKLTPPTDLYLAPERVLYVALSASHMITCILGSCRRSSTMSFSASRTEIATRSS